jgi:hypothetical protein
MQRADHQVQRASAIYLLQKPELHRPVRLRLVETDADALSQAPGEYYERRHGAGEPRATVFGTIAVWLKAWPTIRPLPVRTDAIGVRSSEPNP